MPRAAHVPRVTIDRLVISRERWTFSPADLAFARIAAPSDRFLDLRAWKRRHAMPRWVFFKVPEDPKPCFLDFESPILVDIFCKLARKASELHVSEMLPGIDQCWLHDAEGQRYTSELRIVALDPEPWRP